VSNPAISITRDHDGIVHGQSRVYGIVKRSQNNSRVEILNEPSRLSAIRGTVSVGLAFAKAGRLFSEVTTLDRCRTFQLTTRVEALKTFRERLKSFRYRM
jgi:hypothetical protein